MSDVGQQMNLDDTNTTAPIMVLVLSKSLTGLHNWEAWRRWLTETGRPGSMVFIHGKHPWTVPARYRGLFTRLQPNDEVPTQWGTWSLVEATMKLLERTTHLAPRLAQHFKCEHFSHFVLVSDDTVPMKRLDAICERNESQIVGMDQATNYTHGIGMRDALARRGV